MTGPGADAGASARAGASRDRPRPTPAELEAGGWIRRFVGGPDRLREVRALYESLGHEVRLEPPEPADLADGCEGCVAATALFRVIYTRRAV